MVHVNENGRDFTTFENFSRSKRSETLQLLNISKYSFTSVCDAYQERENTFVCMNRLQEQQSSEMNNANCFHFYRFLWC